MNTLIIYGTKYGCTERCAKSLSGKLTGKVDLVNIKKNKVPGLTKYDRVIIGGSIYVGKIQKEIKEYCTKNLNELKEKKLGLFICCGFSENFNQHMENAFPKELLEAAVAKECFGGELNLDKMNIFHRFLTKIVSKASKKSSTDTKAGAPIIIAENINKLARSLE